MRWVLRLTGVVIAVVALLIVSVSFLPAQSIADLAVREISALTGREMTVKGGARAVFFPVLGVRTGRVTLANAPWGEAEHLLTADSLVIGVRPLALLQGVVSIGTLKLNAADIRLERSTTGLSNWEIGPLGASDAATDGVAVSGGLVLKSVRISDGHVLFRDLSGDRSEEFESLDLRLRVNDRGGSARLNGGVSRLGQRLALSVDIRDLRRFLAGGISDISLSAKGPVGRLRADGRMGFAPLMAETDIDADLRDVPLILKMAGLGDYPLLVAGERARFKGHVIYAGDRTLYVRRSAFGMAGHDFTGDFDLVLSPRPRLTARLRTQLLGVSDAAARTSGGFDRDRSVAGDADWPRTRLGFAALADADADIVLAADAVGLGGLKLGGSNLRLRLAKGRLTLSLGNVAAYGGRIVGEYVINTRGGLSMGGDLSFSDMRLAQLLDDLAGIDNLDAGADFHLNFATKGDSIAEMMSNLSGEGGFVVGAGNIARLDLAGILQGRARAYGGVAGATAFASITGRFRIDHGVLQNDDLLFRADSVMAQGEGTVDVADRRVTYRLTPIAIEGSEKPEFGTTWVPVLISGPWARLGLSADAAGAFDAVSPDRVSGAAKNRSGRETGIDGARRDAEAKLRDELEKAMETGADKTLSEVMKRLRQQ